MTKDNKIYPQKFEHYKELAGMLEWFANNVKVPGTQWNKLLHEINAALPSPGDNQSLEEAAKFRAKEIYKDRFAETDTPDGLIIDGVYETTLQDEIKEAIKAAFIAGAAYVKGGEEDKTDMGVYENYLRETTVTQSPSSIEESGLKEGEEEFEITEREREILSLFSKEEILDIVAFWDKIKKP